MYVLWVLLRVLVIAGALVTTLITVIVVEGPSGRFIVPEGVVINLVAVALAAVAALSLWRDLRGGRAVG